MSRALCPGTRTFSGCLQHTRTCSECGQVTQASPAFVSPHSRQAAADSTVLLLTGLYCFAQIPPMRFSQQVVSTRVLTSGSDWQVRPDDMRVQIKEQFSHLSLHLPESRPKGDSVKLQSLLATYFQVGGISREERIGVPSSTDPFLIGGVRQGVSK